MTTGSPPRTTPREGLHNLPLQLTSFIGREQELVEVTRLLATTRLLTLTGAGGCGKTRLALRVAEDTATSYPDGAWLVELAALADPSLVTQAVASAVGVREVPGRTLTESLVDYLRGRTLLLILDNCEHVVTAAAQLSDPLLRSCPRLCILATSREPLGTGGETTWRVPSLTLPPPATADRLSIDHVTRYEAVRLFIDRALHALPGFTVTDQDASALAEICRRLDGIPLAIELAAARMRVFSVEQIAARLDDRFRLLSTGPRTAMPRQQTLEATVDWSYALLSEPERALLRRLSVFAGGWTFEAAEAVVTGDGLQTYALLDLLAQLVDKSLVIAEAQRGAVRYRLLETIRQYARDRLQESGEAERTRTRHLAYFLGLAEEADSKLHGPEALGAMDRLEEEHDNLRTAMEWGLSANRDAALRLAGALAWFWWERDYHTEGRRWLARTLATSPDRAAARMKALHGAGWLAHHQRDSDEARALVSESLAIARKLDDRWTVAWALQVLGRIAYFDNDPPATWALGRECLDVAEELDDGWLIAWALHLLGIAAYMDNDYPTARAYYERSLALRREMGYQEGVGILLALLGIVAWREGDIPRAYELYREALATTQGLLGSWSTVNILSGFAAIAAAQGQLGMAVRLAGACAAWRGSWQTPVIPLMETVLDQELQRARQTLGEAAYTAAWAAGQAMSLDECIAEALALQVAPTAPTPEPPSGSALADLTSAELQVLRLLAGGRTTREIAAELVVAISTVDRHITHIYGKLGVRNRAEATAIALRYGLG